MITLASVLVAWVVLIPAVVIVAASLGARRRAGVATRRVLHVQVACRRAVARRPRAVAPSAARRPACATPRPLARKR